MFNFNKLVPIISIAVCLFASGSAYADCLHGWSLIQSDIGVTLCARNNEEFIQTVELDKGASLKMIVGTEGYYGCQKSPITLFNAEPNPCINKMSQNTIWDNFRNSFGDSAFSVINGQFFNDQIDPTPLSLSLKSNGSVVSYGDKQEHLKNLVALQIFSDGVRITDPLSWDHVYNTEANDVVVGYRGYGDLPKVTYDTSSEPKTIMGIGGTANNNGRYNKVYIYSSRKYVTRDYAVSLLANSGAIASIVLDSGGSALLTAKGTKLVYGRTGMSSARPVPHAIGVVSGSNSQNLATQYLTNCINRYSAFTGSKSGSLYSCNDYFFCQNTTGGYLGNVTTVAVQKDMSDNLLWYYWSGWGQLSLDVCK